MAGLKRVVLTERDQNLTQTGFGEGSGSAQKQLQKFDTSYSSKKLNELYQEFDAITFGAPNISATTLTQENAYVEQQSAMSVKAKIYISAAILVTLLFAFLAIYNIFVINGLNAGIKLLQEEVQVSESDYKTLYDYYNQLRNSTNISGRVTEEGFAEVSSQSIIDIPLSETQPVAQLTFSSNWFNDLCNFLGGLFGG